MDKHELTAQLKSCGIVAIIRGKFTIQQYLSIAESLLEGGVTALELTLNSQDALEGIRTLREHLGARAFVGAGTVRTAEDVDVALDAGAQFLIAPSLDLESVARAHARNALHIPGVFTASEAQAAYQVGCSLVKLFPADAVGPSYVKALRAPLDGIDFMPTGGIEANNIAAYVKAGAVAFGVGSSLVRGPNQNPSDLEERARQFVFALSSARDKMER